MVVDSIFIIEEYSNLYSMPSSILVWLEEAHPERKEYISTLYKIQFIKEEIVSMEHWEWKRDVLWYKGRIFL